MITETRESVISSPHCEHLFGRIEGTEKPDEYSNTRRASRSAHWRVIDMNENTPTGQHAKRRRFATPEEAMAARTAPDGDCLRWTGYRRPDGYGMMRAWGKTTYAHRVAYVMHFGTIPDGAQIDHTCKMRDCVNPAHLEAVSQQVNLARATRPQSIVRTHCGKGHEFTPENTYRWRDTRKCRTCMTLASKTKWAPTK